MNKDSTAVNEHITRRGFLKTTATAAAVTFVGGCASMKREQMGPAIMHPGGKAEKLRVGLIGCGGRGTGAAKNAVDAAPNVEIVALGDLFQDRLDGCRKHLMEKKGDHVNVADDRCFTGFDNYLGVLGCDIDMVILATPPHFRPQHLKAVIESGKHVFMEKPVAVDPVGIRSVIASSDLATQKGLAIVAGTQRRHQEHYLEAMKRIHDGAIGDVAAAQCYWNQQALWVERATQNWERYQSGEWSDMEWQCRNWLFLTWLSGDHIVEQHVHNLDVVNWAIGATPVSVVGMGGRQQRTEPKFGNIYDHFAIEYEYPGGVRVFSSCRQIPGCSDRVAERIVGTKGVAYLNGSNAEIKGKKNWKYEKDKPPNPYVTEHADLIASIRSGRPLNEGRRVAESTMTAIMGRMSAYTGREFSWKWAMNKSALDLTPPAYEFGDLPVGPVAMPGETKLV